MNTSTHQTEGIGYSLNGGRWLMNALAVRPSTDAERAAGKYGGVELLAAEQRRERLRQDRINELHLQFVDGPVLTLPGGGHETDGPSPRRPDGLFAKEHGRETSKSQSRIKPSKIR
jgi:hypothetical protein